MKNDTVKLTNKLVEEYKSNPFGADGKQGKPYAIHEESKPGLSLKVRQTWKDKFGEEAQGIKSWIFRYRPRSSDNQNIKDFSLSPTETFFDGLVKILSFSFSFFLILNFLF